MRILQEVNASSEKPPSDDVWPGCLPAPATGAGIEQHGAL